MKITFYFIYKAFFVLNTFKFLHFPVSSISNAISREHDQKFNDAYQSL